ncbi:MAG TPA: DUF192 domain-containing protein [Terriglobales bacterium]|jgi:uncharacterized protein|nr:DUF192 domain-containing protein [Terriglobales bacterium]
MPASASKACAYNQTRQAYLATDLAVADTHWSRLRGLMGTGAANFPAGKGLWIVPCHGVHTLGMRFPIDVVYLNGDKVIVHLEENLRPWRVAAVRLNAVTVLELPPSTVRQTQTTVGDQIAIEFGKGEVKA